MGATICRLAVVCFLSFGGVAPSDDDRSSEPRRPHVVLVVADDLGYNDVGYHGSEIKTPVIDKLASAGVRLESYYVQPICAPSRSQLMSGLYQIRTGLQHGNIDDGMPTGLPLNVTTLADRLRRRGYATHLVGKWHLGSFKHDYLPTNRGFDSFYGFLGGNEDHYHHSRCWDTCGLDLYDNLEPSRSADGQYSTWLYANKAAAVVRGHNQSGPLFLYLAFQCPHVPLQAPATQLRRYRRIKSAKRRAYAAMVSAMDQALGQVVSALKVAGMWRDTLLVFTTDNGADTSMGGSNRPLRDGKGALYEGGVRGVGFVSGLFVNASRRGAVVRDLVHVSDWYPTLVKLAGGSLNGTPTDGVDQWGTINEGRKGARQEILHSIDKMFPANGLPLYSDTFNSSVRAAIRAGDWKLMTGYVGATAGSSKCSDSSRICVKGVRNIWLYNITADPTESVDLSEQQPIVVRTLLGRLASYQARAVPAYYPNRDPRADPQYHGGVWGPWL